MYYLVAGNYQKLLQMPGRRYRVIGDSPPVALDCDPLRPTEVPADLPDLCRPYQRLNLFRWAVPEVHTCILGDDRDEPCVLLSGGPLDAQGSPWPSITDAWGRSTPLKQLGWLIQLARLWDPCRQEGVATSLLSLENIGVLGWQMCLFFLVPDRSTPTLAALGACLRQLSPLAPALEKLIGALAAGQIGEADYLLDGLESLVLSGGSSHSIACGATHPGRRENNEDAFAYDREGRYGIVCDGMGGHDGGEVASRMALESLEADLANLICRPLLPVQLRQGLAEALYRANQQILERNRQQNRSQYRQMGTTAVVCCLVGPLLHIAHVGDSRIYLIDQHRCRQLTVDDDVANLEVSLARTTSNAILQIDSSGNLTQALGVVAMASLQPTVQTFVLPESCLILLCSDGLCDGDLVERSWQTTLLPLLAHSDLASGAAALLQLALTELGHDNITFVLIKYAGG